MIYYLDDELDESELMIAIENKDYALLKKLLHSGIDPYFVNKFGTTAVSNACMNGDLESLKILHENGVDINKIILNADIPIIKACLTGNIKLVDYLVKYGANLNSVDNLGRTPLMNAIIYKNIKVIQYLLMDLSIDFYILDRFNKIAFYYALIGIPDKFNIEVLYMLYLII